MSSCPGTVPQRPFPHPRPSLEKCPLILGGHLNLTYFLGQGVPRLLAGLAGRLPLPPMHGPCGPLGLFAGSGSSYS